MAELAGRPLYRVAGLIFLGDLESGAGQPAALDQAREIAGNEPMAPFALTMLAEAETRAGRSAVRTAAGVGALVEELTDREMSILRILPGSASQREIGSALFLSINTVKAYNKSLYRKLGVGSREDAVRAARRLGLI